MSAVIRRIVAIIGGLLMAVGVFLPMLSIPLLRDDPFFRLSPGGAAIILALGGLTILVVLLGRYRWLYLTGLVAIALLIYTYVQVDRKKTAAQSDLKERVIDTPLKNLSHNLVSSVGLRYGWPMMLLGAAITVAVPLVGSRLGRKERG